MDEWDENKRKPRHGDDGICAGVAWWDIVTMGFVISIAILLVITMCFTLPTIITINAQVDQIAKLQLPQRLEAALTATEKVFVKIGQDLLPVAEKVIADAARVPFDDVSKFFSALSPSPSKPQEKK